MCPESSPIDPMAILGAMPDPILVLGVDDKILYGNPGAEQFFATSAAVLRGQVSQRILCG